MLALLGMLDIVVLGLFGSVLEAHGRMVCMMTELSGSTDVLCVPVKTSPVLLAMLLKAAGEAVAVAVATANQDISKEEFSLITT